MSNLHIKFALKDNDFNYQCNFTREIVSATMTKNIRFTVLEKYKLWCKVKMQRKASETAQSCRL